jgi:hypothetical protein
MNRAVWLEPSPSTSSSVGVYDAMDAPQPNPEVLAGKRNWDVTKVIQ